MCFLHIIHLQPLSRERAKLHLEVLLHDIARWAVPVYRWQSWSDQSSGVEVRDTDCLLIRLSRYQAEGVELKEV